MFLLDTKVSDEVLVNDLLKNENGEIVDDVLYATTLGR